MLDLTTGATLNAATLSNGTTGNGTVTLGMLLSRDGRVTAFDNNSTNLVAGTSTNVVRTYRRLLPRGGLLSLQVGTPGRGQVNRPSLTIHAA